MTTRWVVRVCNGRELEEALADGWEPYAVAWYTVSKFKEELRYFLKRKVETHGI